MIDLFSFIDDEIFFNHNNITGILRQKLPSNQLLLFVDSDDFMPDFSIDRLLKIINDNDHIDLLTYDCGFAFTRLKPWDIQEVLLISRIYFYAIKMSQ